MESGPPRATRGSTTEYVELAFGGPMYVCGVEIYETFRPGAVIRVALRNVTIAGFGSCRPRQYPRTATAVPTHGHGSTHARPRHVPTRGRGTYPRHVTTTHCRGTDVTAPHPLAPRELTIYTPATNVTGDWRMGRSVAWCVRAG